MKTEYVHDGHTSVAQTVAGMLGAGMAEAQTPEVYSYAYTPYGEMLRESVTGYVYSGEWYDAATGMQNLRARQYEPAMTRFGQPDVIRGNAQYPASQNRYAYVWNDPVNLVDRNGLLPSVVAESNATAANIAAHNADVDKREAEKKKKAAESAYEVALAAVSGMDSDITKQLAETNALVDRAIGQANSRIEALENQLGRALTQTEKDAVFAEECWNVTNGYEDYRNRQDGYFEQLAGWDDIDKLKEASVVLGAMMMGSGSYLNALLTQGPAPAQSPGANQTFLEWLLGIGSAEAEYAGTMPSDPWSSLWDSILESGTFDVDIDAWINGHVLTSSAYNSSMTDGMVDPNGILNNPAVRLSLFLLSLGSLDEAQAKEKTALEQWISDAVGPPIEKLFQKLVDDMDENLKKMEEKKENEATSEQISVPQGPTPSPEPGNPVPTPTPASTEGPRSIVINQATVIVDKSTMKTNDALDLAVEFLGPGYQDMGEGRFVSADGTRQVRMKNTDLAEQNNHAGAPHMNFELFAPDDNRPGRMEIIENIHIFLEN